MAKWAVDTTADAASDWPALATGAPIIAAARAATRTAPCTGPFVPTWDPFLKAIRLSAGGILPRFAVTLVRREVGCVATGIDDRRALEELDFRIKAMLPEEYEESYDEV